MAITRKPRTVEFTAVNEGVGLDHQYEVVGMTFRGTGLTAAQLLIVRDDKTPGSGNRLADYTVEAATDNADLWGGRQPQIVSALSIDNNTIAGTWVLTVSLKV